MQSLQIFSIVLLALGGHCFGEETLPGWAKEFMDKINRELTETKGQLTETKGQLTETKGQLTETKGQLTETKGQLTEIKGQLTEIKGQLTEMKKRLNETEGKLKEMKSMEKLILDDNENMVQRMKKIECEYWSRNFETAAIKIGEIACKLLDPKSTGPKPRHTVTVPQLILTTAKGSDHYNNILRWFQDLRHYFARMKSKPKSTHYQYVVDLGTDLINAINLAKKCKDDRLYDFIPKNKLNETIQLIQDFRSNYLENAKHTISHRAQEPPSRNVTTLRIPPLNVKKLNEILAKIFNILCDTYFKKFRPIAE